MPIAKFSEGWMKSFRTHECIRKLGISGELKSANVIPGEEFKVKLKFTVSKIN